MKKVIAIAEILALSITPTASFADHLEPKESEIRPGGDLAHTNLSGRNLSGADLSGADLSGADLSGADLTFTNLKGANLSGANLTFTNLKGANLSGANLSGSSLFTELDGVKANNLIGCPEFLPFVWVCENNSLIKR